MPVYYHDHCDAPDCIKERGKVLRGCTKCQESGWVMIPNRPEPSSEPLAIHLHDWRCYGPGTEKAMDKGIEKLWVCEKCGDVSLLAVPPLRGCDTEDTEAYGG